MKKELDYTESSGNVFADLGLEDADELLAKAEMVRQIASIIEHRHLTQTAAGQILGIKQPNVSRLLNGHVEDFSLDRLIAFLRALGRDVEIRVKKKPRSRAHARLAVAAAA
jgi:predicted XRE-type DNA-binding protein